ncbi:MAG: hypothetical protein HYT78_01585 [Deltaproteobacteria bacterium]|nr:hypothetical protein [Deltaproteobacteria bacterium]
MATARKTALRGHAVGLRQGKVLIRKLNAYETPTLVQMAPIIDGKPDVTKISAIDLEELGESLAGKRSSLSRRVRSVTR